MVSPNGALRKSVNAASAKRNAEEHENLFFLRKRRLQVYKLGFLFVTCICQSLDALSDIVTESVYFFFRETEKSGGTETPDFYLCGENADSFFMCDDGSNGTGIAGKPVFLRGAGTEGTISFTAGVPELQMGTPFDLCYGAHGVASLVVSGYILHKLFSLTLHLRKMQRGRSGDGQSDSSTASVRSENNDVAPAMHRAAARLHESGKLRRHETAKRAGDYHEEHQQQEGGGGASVCRFCSSHPLWSRGPQTARRILISCLRLPFKLRDAGRPVGASQDQ